MDQATDAIPAFLRSPTHAHMSVPLALCLCCPFPSAGHMIHRSESRPLPQAMPRAEQRAAVAREGFVGGYSSPHQHVVGGMTPVGTFGAARRVLLKMEATCCGVLSW